METKIALVTGGNSGIGQAISARLRAEGYDVHVLGSNPERTHQVANELGATGIVADLKNPHELEKVGRSFLDSGLDVLVHNAGIGQIIPIDAYDDVAFAEHFDVNVRAPLLLTKELLPALEKRRGAICMVSSIITVHGIAAFGLYAATKGAIEAFVHSAALELAPRGIRINAVAPGAILTPFITKMGLDERQQKEALEYHKSTIPLGRLGVPDDVAEVILAQLKASYVTGSIWSVDGGVDA